MSVMQNYAPMIPAENQFGRSGSFRAEEIESGLRQVLAGLTEPLRAGCERVIGAGGKRLRPELVMRCAEIGPRRLGRRRRRRRRDRVAAQRLPGA